MNNTGETGKDTSRHDTSTFEEAEEMECEYCGLLRGFKLPNGSVRDPTESESWNFFHGPCSSCSAEDGSLDSPLLCSVCNHMRLRHLIECLSHDRSFLLQLGTVRELQERPDCSFCNFIFDTVIKLKKEREEDIRDHAWVGIETYEPNGFTHIGIGIIGFQEESVELRVKIDNLKSSTSHRSLQDMPSEMIPWEKVKAWMGLCEGRPENSQDGPPSPLPKSFRLIDINERCIVGMPPGSNFSFVALSYVWGAEPKGKSTTALRDNIAALQIPASLDQLPATIEDAIQACRQLNERYLWVDRLCIIQDDLDDKREQISSMGSIYSSASLVIIAVCGGHMDAGLAGVSHPRGIPHPREVLSRLRLVPQLPNYWGLNRETIWASRGRTYQEGVLARRKLFFTPTEVWFDCSHGIQREVGDPWETLRPISLFRPDKSRDIFTEFMRHMSAYSRRSLTNQSDVYSATEGIMSELYKDTSGRHYYGLPCKDFDRALLWMCSHVPRKSPLRTSEDMYLPTWSWSSFNGGLTRLPNDFEHHFCSTLLSWASYDYLGKEKADLKLKPLDEPSSPLIWREVSRYPEGAEIAEPYWFPQLYLALACELGFFEGISNYDVSWETNSSFSDRKNALLARFPTYPSFWAEIQRLCQVKYHGNMLDRLESDINRSIPLQGVKPGPLVSRSQIARFQMGKHQTKDYRSRIKRLCHHCDVLDESALTCGYIYLDEPRMSPRLSTESISTFDFMALSISARDYGGVEYAVGVQNSRQELERIITDEEEEITFFDNTGEALLPCPVINVMVIGRRSNGLSHRMGVGWIFMRSWTKAARRFETIVLE